MKSVFAYAFVTTLLLAALAAGWQLRGCHAPASVRTRTTVQTDTVYRDDPISREDTATTAASGAAPDVAAASTPTERIIYETRTETVRDTIRDCFARPPGFDARGLVSSRPVRIDPGGVFSGPSVTLTTWQPDALRYEQAVYDVPQPDWHLWPSVGAAYGPRGLAADALVHLRRRRLHAWGGYRVAEMRLPAETRLVHGPTAGVRVHPFTFDW